MQLRAKSRCMDSRLQEHSNENTWESSLENDQSAREGNDRVGPRKRALEEMKAQLVKFIINTKSIIIQQGPVTNGKSRSSSLLLTKRVISNTRNSGNGAGICSNYFINF